MGTDILEINDDDDIFSLSLSLLRFIKERMSAARNGIPPDVVRKAEMQMKRKAPEDLNGRTRTRRKEKDGDDGAVPSSTPSMRFNYALEKQLRESSIAGFAFTCVMHRERSAMKEALTLLRECIDDDAVKISPMKMPCKAFAFLSFIDEEEGEKQVVNNNSSAIKVPEMMKKVVRVAMRRQNVRFFERMIAISTTCEYNEDAIERAIDRLGIGSQNTFKTFAICHRDSFSKALLSTDKESEKWKSKAVTNAVAAAVAKRIKSVDLQDPDVVIFVVVLAVNDNSTTTSTNTPTRRLGLSFAAKDSNVFTVKKGKGIVATSLKCFCKR